MKIAVILVSLLGFIAQICFAKESKDAPTELDQSAASTSFLKPLLGNSKSQGQAARIKRGYGHGGGGHGGGGGGSGYGHGPGAGGGARGPVYFCGWVGSKMGSSYGSYGK